LQNSQDIRVKAIVVMGVSGSGKTTVGSLLATSLGRTFLDADRFHPPANIAKMAAGEPLTDDDRAPWLDRLNQLLREHAQRGEPAVLACSALKESYRERLARGVGALGFVYLKGDLPMIRARMLSRRDHYMKADLLESQFAALEEPAGAIALDIGAAPEVIVEQIRAALASPGS
jgi:gluconokinase